jgi:hypothetical protein
MSSWWRARASSPASLHDRSSRPDGELLEHRFRPPLLPGDTLGIPRGLVDIRCGVPSLIQKMSAVSDSGDFGWWIVLGDSGKLGM